MFPLFMSCLIGAFGLFSAEKAGAGINLDPTRVQLIAPSLEEEPAGFGRPIDDRSAWERLAKRPAFQEVIEQAEGLLDQPMPDSPDSLFLDFSKTGNRTRWQKVAARRRQRMAILALAECLENKGRFIKPLRAAISELCGERTWVYPAHDRDLKNFRGEQINLDLGSTMLGWNMATVHYWLNRRLSETTRDLIEHNLEWRLFKPYRDMVLGERDEDWWMRTTNNWNAVCHAGVVGAAQAVLRSRGKRASFMAAAEEYSEYFLDGFTDDGYCSEGVGYWNYGFGYFIQLSETVYQATGGKVDFFRNPRVRAPALFGVRIVIVDDVCPAFADCSVGAEPSSDMLYYISRRFDLGLDEERADPVGPSTALYTMGMYSFSNSASRGDRIGGEKVRRGIRDWFETAGVLILRPGDQGPEGFAVALKGGHNAEHHNHNDVGSYVVVVDDEMVLIDPGAEVYTARTFSSQRYDSDVLNSFGHPVPRIDGQLQRTGSGARGKVLGADFSPVTDRLRLDLRSAYDQEGIEKLERSFEYHRRGEGAFIVTDECVFKTPRGFETALVTLGEWEKVGEDLLRIRSEGKAALVQIDTGGKPYRLEAVRLDADVRTSRKPQRLAIALTEPVEKARIRLTVVPDRDGSRRF